MLYYGNYSVGPQLMIKFSKFPASHLEPWLLDAAEAVPQQNSLRRAQDEEDEPRGQPLWRHSGVRIRKPYIFSPMYLSAELPF